jgi:hypothetical protein
MYDAAQQPLLNQEALDNPQIGDYWHEMFCPYFFIVDRKADKFTVLSLVGGADSFSRKSESNAKIDNADGTWSFDYSKSMVVDQNWIRDLVRYQHHDGFVADVVRNERGQRVVTEWREHVQQNLLNQIATLQDDWETFTGWKFLREGIES